MRHFLFLVAFLLIPSMCFANKYEDAPEQYICIDTGQIYETYLDENSVTSLQYAPPYYVIQCNNITFNYMNNITSKMVVKYFYDYENKAIQVQMPEAYAYDEDGTLSDETIIDEPPIAVDPSSHAFSEAIMLFKQIYGAKYANTFQETTSSEDEKTLQGQNL